MSYPWRDGNRVHLLINGEAYFPSLFESIGQARTEVLLETFIIFEDEVGQQLQHALMAAARRGVRVQIIVDGFGTDLSRDYVARLNEAGVTVHLYDPRPRLLGMRTNLFRRMHRKIVVVDGQVAFVGGINYGEDHLAERGGMAKQDYAVKLQGPVVADIRQASLALLQGVLGASNWALMALLIYTLLPAGVAYPHVLATLMISSVAGLITHIPAGLGVLEMVFVALLRGEVKTGAIIAALIAYRALYYLLPLALATLTYLVLERQATSEKRQADSTARP